MGLAEWNLKYCAATPARELVNPEFSTPTGEIPHVHLGGDSEALKT